MKVLTYGTEHKFPEINTPKLVTASFGSTPRDKPGGAQATHINGDYGLMQLTHKKGTLLNKMGSSAAAHLPIADLQRQRGFDYTAVEEVFPQGARFRHDGAPIDINNVVQFQQLIEQFDANGTFTTQQDGRQIAVCPSLMKGKKPGDAHRGLLALDGGEISEEEQELIAQMIAKFALDYFVIEMTATLMGIKAVDLHTSLLPAAFQMAGDMIKRKAGV
jgi:hypothetical protein